MNADLVYAAGFMDADGTFIFQTRKDRPGVVHVRPVLAAYNVCRAPLELLVSLFGGSVQPVQRRKPTLSVQLQWRVQGKRATDGAAAMLPYLRVKQRQAAIFVRFMAEAEVEWSNGWRGTLPDSENARRHGLWRELRSLNAPG